MIAKRSGSQLELELGFYVVQKIAAFMNEIYTTEAKYLSR